MNRGTEEPCDERVGNIWNNSPDLAELMTWMTRTGVSKRIAARRQRLAASGSSLAMVQVM
jgi:hypothetical protein